MQRYDKLFTELMNAGLVYRYTKDRWESLLGLREKEFPSPYRVVETPKGKVVEELIQPTLEPIILSKDEWVWLENLASLWEKFLAAQRQIFYSDPDVARMVATQKELDMAFVESGYDVFSPFIRLDCVRGDDGQFRVVDINSTRPAGVGDLIVLQSCMDGYDDKLMRTTFTSTVKKCYDQWSKKENQANIGLLTDILAGYFHNIRILSEVLSKEPWVRKAEVISQVSVNNSPECILRSRIKEGHPKFVELEVAYQNGTCVISPLYRRWVGNKIWMYLCGLRKYKEIFSAFLGDEYVFFKDKLFAQTGVFQDNFVHFSDDTAIPVEELNRKEWVVKNPSGSSGIGTVIGRRVSKKRWNEHLDRMRNGSIFQKLYRKNVKEEVIVLNKHGEPEVRQLYIKYGVFIFHGVLAGVEVFARPDSLVHGSRDAYFSFAVPSSKDV